MTAGHVGAFGRFPGTPTSTERTYPMNFQSARRGRRLSTVGLAFVSIVIVACSGATAPTPANNIAGTPDSGATGNSSNGDDASPGSTGSTGSTGSSGSSSGGGENGVDSGGVVVTVDGSACPAKGSEVVMIGDSYLALSESTSPPAGEITEHLQSLATAAGALASGDTYRYYYESGANMATTYTNSTITPIPTQFANAVTANADIKYVIMDGGGNDILLENTDCLLGSPDAGISSTCEAAVQSAISAATTLFGAMKTAGVQKVIYFFYPHLPTNLRPSVNVLLDYAYPLVQAACENAPIPCYFVDTRPAFNGNDATLIGPDGIHPTTAGSDMIAGLIWNEMLQECIALSP